MSKKALVVGINAYAPPNALPSCIKDADAFSDLLRSEYKFDAVIDLRDAQATRAGMLDGLKTLVAAASPQDEIVFYYSGHGYSFQQGDAQVDSLVGQDSQFLTIEDFAAATAAAPPGVLTVVLDSCFSGGMTKVFIRVAEGVKPLQIKCFTPAEPSMHVKAFNQPAIRVFKDFATPNGRDPAVLAVPTTDKAFSLVEPPADGVQRRFILVSACRGDETAAASTDRTHGMSAFTFCLLTQIAAGGRRVGVSKLVDDAGQELRTLGITQTPMLKVPTTPTGLADRAFLLWDAPVPELQGSPQPALAAIAPLAQTTGKGFAMTTSFDLNSEIKSIVLATSPGVAASLNGASHKGFDPSVPNGIDKGWFDDLTRVVATVVPAVLQGMKDMPPPPPAKAFGMPQPFDKGWLDNLVSIITTTMPPIIAALKSPQPGSSPNPDLVAAAQKGWFDDLTHVIANVLPVVLNAVKDMPPPPPGSATKGFDPLATNAGGQTIDEKSFWSTLAHIASVAVPMIMTAL